MKINEGNIDRALRVIVGIVLLAMVFVGPQTVWGWIGVIPLLTGAIGICPLYSVLGINSCPISQKRA
jgi:hypothetical protein